MNNILESDPDYNDGAYDLPLSDSLKRSLKLSSDAMYCYGLSREEYRNNMTNEEIDDFHLSTLKLSYEQALEEYEKCSNTRLGRLIANRELPVLKRAKELLDNQY